MESRSLEWNSLSRGITHFFLCSLQKKQFSWYIKENIGSRKQEVVFHSATVILDIFLPLLDSHLPSGIQ